MKKLITFAFAAAFAFAGTTSAATVAELQAQIDALLAQLAGVTTTTTTTGTGYVYTMDLTLGSEGADVVALQSFLESKGTLVIPAGVSKGYFGQLTKSALASYQAMVGISPAVGYFGPITRANVNASAMPVVDNGGSTTTTTSGLSGGETSLEDFNLDREDDVEEGEMDHVATIEFDVEDADAQINRVDLEFVFTGNAAQADNDPWDVFETITLMVDGDEIAEEDVDDEDDWKNDDSPFVFRLSNIDFIAEEGDEVEIEVYLTSANNVDGADTNDASWTIAVDDDGIRAVDGAGVQNYIGDDSDTVSFDIEEEGDGEEIKIKSSSADPDAATLEVEDDDQSAWYEVFVFKLEAEENDIDIDSLDFTVTTGTEDYNDVISDIKVSIDGDDSFDDVTVTDGNTTSADLVFDIDKDATVDADDTVEVIVMVEFKQADGVNYTVSETIAVQVTGVEGEGADDVSDTSALTSETHTLELAVAEITNVDSEVSADDPNNSGRISWTFTVDASDSDEDIEFDVADNDDVNGGTDEVEFTVTGTDNTIATTALVLLDGDATFAAGTWTVAEGDEAEFALDTTFTTTDANDNGTYRVRLDEVAGVTVDEVSSGLALSN